MGEQINNNSTPADVTITCNNISGRAIAKALSANTSIKALNLSNSKLDTKCGKLLAEALSSSSSLQKLELNGNVLGPEALTSLSVSLKENNSLKFLSLEKNPLTTKGQNISGIQALGAMLKVNKSLTGLNLFGTGINAEGGRLLLSGLLGNDQLRILEVGNNGIGLDELKKVSR